MARFSCVDCVFVIKSALRIRAIMVTTFLSFRSSGIGFSPHSSGLLVNTRVMLLQLQVLVTSVKSPGFWRTKDTRNVCYLLTVLTPLAHTSACDTFPYMICEYLRDAVAWLPSVTPPLSVAITTSDTPCSCTRSRSCSNMAHPGSAHSTTSFTLWHPFS